MGFLDNFFSKRWALILLLLVLVAIVLAPALLGFKVMGTDALELVIPQMAFYKYSFETGQSPFWNPYIAVGFPNFVSIRGFPYTPINLLLYFFSPVTVHYYGMFLTLFLAMVFFVLFCRKLGLGVPGSLVGAMAYLTGNIFWARDVGLATSLFVQACLFWVAISIYQSKTRKHFMLLVSFGAVIVGYAWLSANYFQVLYFFLALLSFTIFLCLKSSGGDLTERKKRLYKILVPFLAIFLIGTIIGSLQLMPTYVITQYSQRSAGFDYSQAQGWALGAKDLLNFTHLTSVRGLDAYLYMGMIPLMFFVFSFLIRKNSWVNFFRWLFFIVLAIAIKGSPIFWLIVHLPVFNFFQGAGRFMLVGIFAGAVLVGFGLEKFMVLVKEIPDKVLNIVNVVSVVILVLLLLTLWLDKHEIYPVATAGLFLVLAYSAVMFFLKKPARLLSSLLLISAIEFIALFYIFNGANTLARSTYEAKPLAVDFFKKSPGRILPLFVDDWDDLYFPQILNSEVPPWSVELAFSIESQTYRPLYQLLNQIESAEINDPLLNVDMGRLLALIGTRQLVTSGGEEKLNKLYLLDKNNMDISIAERFRLLKERLPLVDFLGIRYILTAVSFNNENIEPIDLPSLGYVGLRFHGVPADKVPLPVHIYYNPQAKPLVYFTSVDGFKSDSMEIYREFKASGFKGMFVECRSCNHQPFNTYGKIIINNEKNGLVKLTTDSTENQFLVFTQNYLPGWEASIDGKDIPIYKVNTVFMGIFVPAGIHQVEFVYNYWNLFDPRLVFGKEDKNIGK